MFNASFPRNPADGSAQATKSGDEALGRLPEWDLTHLYPGASSPEFNNAFDEAAKKARSFSARWKGKLEEASGKTGDDGLGAAIETYEALGDTLGRLGSFAGLSYYANAADPTLRKLYGDTSARITEIYADLLFFELELNRLDEETINRALEADARFAHYRPWVLDLRLEKPHQLDDRIEQLFMEKSTTGGQAFNRLFDQTMDRMRFDVDGEKMPLEKALNLLSDTKEPVRRKAAEALAATFKDNLPTFSLIMNTVAKDTEINSRWHAFEDIADSRHLSNRVERAVVDALTEAVREAYPRLSHRYYAMKAKWLGMEQMNYWDRNAPLPDVAERVIPWDEARDTVLSAYGAFSPDMADIARRFFDEQWIDAPIRPGKRTGAFAHPTVPSAHPYVLVNYLGKPRDVMTLAHELGHGVHQVLAAKQGALMCSTPLTLAETASVFGEMLTFRALLSQTADKAKRKAMLAQKVEDMINTVVRQIAFYQFERKVHTARREGELTEDQINAMWMSVQAESLGPAIKLADGYETYWSYVPHFIHSPFYVYAYAFGDCLVNSLYAVYQNAESGFQDKYFEMLKAGGTKHHSELLKPFDLDASDPAFWSKGLSMIEGLIDELEALDNE
ncbi:M3 family oligoendopeptidase [Martelella lutilitoris]|uniref:M3 family oligoendopeptidase n=1 Tax=Martelella lutilitoris TaxID=2583532 RepID=A0A5C4JKK4_9HYPH|nr:M3 family oligoendopeptidase [Martelella lutilitoris]TNB46045.1 M3 family oligoendopeptidase [Martelella lutilitoris]